MWACTLDGTSLRAGRSGYRRGIAAEREYGRPGNILDDYWRTRTSGVDVTCSVGSDGTEKECEHPSIQILISTFEQETIR